MALEVLIPMASNVPQMVSAVLCAISLLFVASMSLRLR